VYLIVGGDLMAKTLAQIRATNKYDAQKYDRASILLPKGEKERIKNHANTMSESLNAFINRAIAETIERDNAQKKSIDVKK
jgi:hypothetical protein